MVILVASLLAIPPTQPASAQADDPGADEEGGAETETETETETPPPANTFATTVAITVPPFNDNLDGTSIFTGSQLTVSYTKAETAPDGCTVTAEDIYEVQDNGEVELVGAAARLIDMAGDPATSCTYDVNYSPSDSAGKLSGGDGTAQTSSSDTLLTVSYGLAVSTHFDITPEITVPPYDDDNNRVNDFAGTTITISVTPVGQTAGFCAGNNAEIIAVIQDNGTLSITGSPARLVDRPAGAFLSGHQCEYGVIFTLSENSGLFLLATADTTVTRDDTTATGIFGLAQTQPTFAPDTSIRISNIDQNEDNINDYSGTSFTVSFAPLSIYAPTSRARAECTAAATETYQVGDNGIASLTSTAAALVDRWQGAHRATDRCQYDVSFPVLIERSSSGPGLSLGPNRFASLRNSDLDARLDKADSASARYGPNYFEVTADLTVPQFDDDNDGDNDFAGATLSVNFSSNMLARGCDNRSIRATVLDDGTLSYTDSPARLVDRPNDATEPSHLCQYGTVNFVAPITSNLAVLLGADNSPDTSFSKSDSSVSAAFGLKAADTFAPDVSIEVGELEDDTNLRHDFAEVSFTVSYARASGANQDCTATAEETYEITHNGTAELTSTAAALVNRWAGVSAPADKCTYDVIFPASLTNAANLFVLRDSATLDAELAKGNSATANYEDNRGFFSPTVSITVPPFKDNPDGTSLFKQSQITVGYLRAEGANGGCTASATEIYEVDDDGNVALQGEAARLVGQTGNPGTDCSYGVAFTFTDSANKLELTSGASDSVDRNNTMLSASYFNTHQTYFEVTPDITVPPFTDQDNNNQFADTTITISFTAPEPFASFGCVAPGDITATIQSNGDVTLTGSPLRLLDRPRGAWEAFHQCNYRVTQTLSANSGLAQLNALTAQVSGRFTTLSVIFGLAQDKPNFAPDVSITIDSFDDNDDGTHDFSGVSFQVSYAPASGLTATCTTGASETYRIDDDGLITRTSAAASLADAAAGAYRTSDACAYDVTFPFQLQDGRGASVGRHAGSLDDELAAGNPASADYTYSRVNYRPSVDITVPPFLDNPDGSSIFTGSQITVEYDRASDSPSGCTASATETYEVRRGGAPTLEGDPASLRIRAGTPVSNCSYLVVFSENDSASKLQLARASSSTDITSTSLTATYQNAVSTFIDITPDIMVPPFDDDNNGVNDFSGATITITVTATGQFAGFCRVANDIVAVIQDSGNLELTGSPLRLLDRPSGTFAAQHHCSYAVDFALSANSGLVELDNSDTELTRSDTTASAIFTQAEATANFAPDVSIQVAGDFSGISFTVSYARSIIAPEGCTASASETYQVGTDGTARRTSPPASLASLLAESYLDSHRCIYVATFPALLTNAANLVVSRDDQTTDTNLANHNPASASYVGNFYDVTADISVPQFDDDNDGSNDFAGATITVRFRSPMADSGCAPAQITATVQPSGSLNYSGSPARLVRRPPAAAAPQAECRYTTVTFTPSANSNLAQLPGADAGVSTFDPEVSAAFGVAEADTFAPQVNISVPDFDDNNDDANDFSGVSFTVSFAPASGAHQDCTPSDSETYQVDDDRNVNLTSDPASLVNRRAGVHEPADQCAYVATFSPTATGTTGIDITPDTANADPDLTKGNPAAVAYTNTETTFAPAVALTVPQVDEGGDGANDFSGVSFTLGFTSADSNCTQSASETHETDRNGNVARTSAAASLIDRPDGVADRCAYALAITSAAVPSRLVPASPVPSVGAAAGITVQYRQSNTTFTPDFDITVPEYMDAEGNPIRPSPFSGIELEITVQRTSESAEECSAAEADDLIYTVQDNGSVTPNSPRSLVDLAQGEDTPCEYDVLFPQQPEADNSLAALSRMGDGIATMNGDTGTITQSYLGVTRFVADITIQVPQYDHPTLSQKAFSGRSFALLIRGAYDPEDSTCQDLPQTIITYDVDTQGQVASTDVPLLVDRPLGNLELRCEHSISFPPSTSGSAGTLVRQTAGLDTRTAAASPPARATYFAADSHVGLSITIADVPETMAGATTGVTLEVSFTPDSDNHANCTSGLSPVTYEVRSDGSVATEDTLPSLLDRPTGVEERCAYVVGFPDSAGSAAVPGQLLNLLESSQVDVMVSADITRSYVQADFAPSVNIGVPQFNGDDDPDTELVDESDSNAFVGVDFVVSYTSSVDGCTAAGGTAVTETYEVASGGDVVLSGDAAVLVDHLSDGTTRCSYAAAFASDAVPGDLVETSAGATVSAAAGVAASYTEAGSVFAPSVSIGVPQFNGDDDPDTELVDESASNAFVGVTFTVSFSSSVSGCTASDSETYEVASGGAVELSGDAAVLVDRPGAGAQRCVYDVAFASDAVPDDLVQTSAGLTITRAVPVSAQYVNAASGFTPEPDISVPQFNRDDNPVTILVNEGLRKVFAGVEFTVTYTPAAGSDDGCAAAEGATVAETYEVDSGGDVVLSGDAVELVDRPQGITDRCSYAVALASDAVPDDLVQVTVNPSISATDASPSVSFTNTRTTFAPDVRITHPAGHANARFSVVFNRASGANPGCTPTATEIYLTATATATRPVLFGDAAELVDRPQGVTDRCLYDLVFPEKTAGDQLVRQTHDTTYKAPDGFVEARYVSAQNIFNPVVSLSVPQYDANNDDINDFAGEQFTVIYTIKLPAPHRSCTPDDSEIYEVRDTGMATLEGDAAELIDTVVGLAGNCEYLVDIEYAQERVLVTGLYQEFGNEEEVSAADRNVLVSYLANNTNFTPTISLSVPPRDSDGDSTHDFFGTTLRVFISPVSEQLDGARCSRATSVAYRVAANGSVSGTAPELKDRPGQVEGRCSYDLVLPAWAVDPAKSQRIKLSGDNSHQVSHSARSVSGSYQVDATLFTFAQASIDVPEHDYDGDGINDYSGFEIEVGFAGTATSDAGCSSELGESPATQIYVVDDNGDVAPFEPVYLADTVVGVAGSCAYDVVFPPVVASILRSQATPVPDTSISSADTVSSVSYASGATRFAPGVDIVVPQFDDYAPAGNDFSGSRFAVIFRRAVAPGPDAADDDITTWCTERDDAVYQVRDNGGVTVEGDEASLVDTVEGLSGRCSYTAEFPQLDSAAKLRYARFGGDSDSVDNAPTRARGSYATTQATHFEAAFEVSVPPFDDNGDRANDFSGVEITLSFSSAFEGFGCEPPEDLVVEVQDGGSLSPALAPVTLLNRPPGVSQAAEQCPYAVEFSLSGDGAAEAAADSLALRDGYTTGFGVANSTIVGVYGLAAAAPALVPAVSISVPEVGGGGGVSDYSGVSLSVSYGLSDSYSPTAAAVAACTASASEVYVVDDNGDVALSGAAAALVFRWAGAYRALDVCEYDVEFPPSVTSSAGVVAALDTVAADTDVTRASPAATASYVNARTDFVPAVLVEVPQFNGDDDPGTGADESAHNAFAGVSFTVTFTRAGGADSGCTASDSEIHTVADGGSVSRSGAAASLVDRPQGVTSRCEYSVAFASSAVPSRLVEASASTSVSAAARSVAADYDNARTEFAPVVAVEVPQFNGDDDPGTGADESAHNAFAGVAFTVTFTRAGGADSGCTPSDSEIHTVADGGSVSRTGAAASLVDRPQGVTSRCEYSVSFASSAVPSRLVEVSAGTSVSAAARSVAADYDNARTEFAPAVTIEVPQFNGDDSPNNAYAGVSFTVTFTRAGSADRGCTASDTETHTVGDGGTVARAGAAASLVDRPQGVEARCSYGVSFASSAVPSRLVEVSAGTSVSATARSVAADYDNILSDFVPEVAIEVPQFNGDDSSNNAYTGVSFTVTFTRAGGADGRCTASDTETHTVGDGGTVSRTSDEVTLVDRPQGVEARCSYAVSFASSAVPSRLVQASASSTVSAAAKSVAADYDNILSDFVPEVAIEVPQFNADGRSVNAYAGVSFTVTFTRVGGADGRCTASDTETHTVGDGGTVSRTSDAASLVDRPQGVTSRCEYSVAFASSAVPSRLVETSASSTMNALAKDVSADFDNVESDFEPVVTIEVSQFNGDDDPGTGADESAHNAFADVAFTVTFTRAGGADGGCTASDSETHTVASGGSVSRTSDAASLVDRPQGVEDRCSYDVSFASSAVPSRLVEASASSTVNALAKDVAADFDNAVTRFAPAVSVEVSQFNGDDDPGTGADESAHNAFADVAFTVTFTRVSGSDGGCTASATETHTVGDGGSVSLTGAAASLVDRPEGVTVRCEYTVAFSSSAVPSRLVEVSAGTSVSATSKSVAADFDNAVTRFAPAVAIEVPQFSADDDPGTGADESAHNAFAGVAFTVTFTRVSGSDGGCTASASEIHTVANGGSVSLTGAAASLVDRPEGVTARCEYTVAFSSSAVPSRLVEVSAGTSVSATARSVAADYDNAISYFAPAVAIEVPQFNADDDSGTELVDESLSNAFAGHVFTVSFTRAGDADENCTESASETHRVKPNGDVVLAGAAASLVDRLESVEARCSYDVAFASFLVPGRLFEVSITSTVSATAKAVIADYGNATKRFVPAVTIEVSQFNADDDPGTVADESARNAFAGVSFTISFTRVSGSNENCTESASEIHTVGDGGTVSLTGAAASLVDRPRGVLARCFYDVSFASDSVPSRLVQASAGDSVSAAAKSVAADYDNAAINFAPAVAVEVSQFNGDDDPGTVADESARNAFAGVSFTVSFTRAGDADGGCTASETEIHTVGDGGTVSLTGAAASLVDRPEGVTARCSYDVAFASSAVPSRLVEVSAGDSVSATARDVEADYDNAAINFAPAVAVEVSQFNGDDDPGTVADESARNAFAGVRFTVAFTRAGDADGGCTASDTETHTVGDGGMVSLTGAAASLVDRPEGVTARCEYTVAFTSSAVPSRLVQASAGDTVSATARDVEADYDNARTEFAPAVAIEVPQFNGDDDPGTVADESARNAFAEVRFTVSFTRAGDADGGCTASATETHTVGDNGTVSLTSAAASLVDRPEGVTARCSYDVVFASDAVSVSLVETSIGTSVSALSPVSADYGNVQSNFAPNTTITVPIGFGDVSFTVTYTSSAPGCTASDTETYLVADDSSTSANLEGDPATLVDRPENVVARCAYAAAFASAAVPDELLQASADTSVTATTSASVSYNNAEIVFVPQATITVPQFNADGSSNNAFAGVVFTVTFSSPDDRCSSSVSERHVVDNVGTVRLEPGSGVSLIGRPEDSDTVCAYDVVFASSAVPDRLVQSSAGVSVDVDELAVAADYDNSRTSFVPAVSVEVPQFNADGGSANAFAGVAFTVTFTRVGSADSGCTASAEETHAVADGGLVSLSSAAASLVDRPEGVIARCAYDVVFASSAVPDRLVQVSAGASVSATARTVDAEYGNSRTNFAPAVAVEVPQFNTDGGTANAFADVVFTVTFTRAGDADGGCTASAEETHTVADGGLVSLSSAAASLVDRPEGVIARCAYDVSFASDAVPDRLVQSSAGASVSATARAVDAEYGNSRTNFAPAVAVEVPQFNADGSSVNAFADVVFTVTFTRAGSSDSGCTASAEETHTVGDGGLVSLSSAAASLVDRPEGVVARCVYDVVFASDAVPDRLVQSSAGASVSATARAVDAEFGNVRTNFAPAVSVEVSQFNADGGSANAFAGVAFTVTFTRASSADSGCTASATETHTVADGGLVSLSSAAASLVDRPEGVIARCTYDVVFASLAVPSRLVQVSAGASVSATARAVDAEYGNARTNFAPAVSVEVPQFDADGGSVNAFAGVAFTVTFTRASSADSGCTASATETHTVADSGTVSLSSAAASLVDRPEGVVARCAYDVVFASSAVPDRLVQASAGASVSATARAVAAGYDNAVTNFAPAVAIEVPQYNADDGTANAFAGVVFTVTFTRAGSSDFGCTASASETHTVADGGTVSLSSAAASLVDRPEGVIARCAYDVVFASDAVPDRLVQSSAGASVSATARAVDAEYGNSRTNFAPAATIEVPQFNAEGSSANAFAGVVFTVTFTRVGSADSGCTASASETHTVADGGLVSLSSAAASLVDRPEGVTARCAYTVVFASDAVPDRLVPSSVGSSVTATARAVVAGYGNAVSGFAPDVAVEVPQFNADGGTTNAFAGVVFTVTFTRAGSADSGCTASAEETHTVADSGTVSLSSAVASLVDRPEGVIARCTYDVSFASSAVPSRLVQSSAGTSVSATARAVAADFTNAQTIFSPTVNITSASGAATSMVVNFTSADADCTPSDTETYDVDSNGNVSLSSDAASLIDRPQDSADRCSYAVEFPPQAASGRLALLSGASTSVSALQAASAEYRYVPPPQSNAGAGSGAGAGTGAGAGAGTGSTAGTGSGTGADTGAGTGSTAGTGSGTGTGAGTGAGTGSTAGPAAGTGPAADSTETATQSNRQPVSVVLKVPARAGQAYSLGETFRVRVFVPGACGSDTGLFGGTTARVGWNYSVPATVGDSTVIGPGAAQTNPQATYDLPAFTRLGSQLIGCVLRVVEIASPTGCTLRSDRQDVNGERYVDVTAVEDFKAELEYDCGLAQTRLQLSRGWTILRFNGRSGTTPAEFARALNDAISSIWVWNPQQQAWSGWSSSASVRNLTRLNQGDLVMAYVPRSITFSYSPTDLLDPPTPSGSTTLPPLYSLHMFGGQNSANLSGLLVDFVGVVPVIFRWDSQNQQWNYHLPGYQPVPSVQIPWFDTVAPGDTMFIYNASPQSTTIPWS